VFFLRKFFRNSVSFNVARNVRPQASAAAPLSKKEDAAAYLPRLMHACLGFERGLPQRRRKPFMRLRRNGFGPQTVAAVPDLPLARRQFAASRLNESHQLPACASSACTTAQLLPQSRRSLAQIRVAVGVPDKIKRRPFRSAFLVFSLHRSRAKAREQNLTENNTYRTRPDAGSFRSVRLRSSSAR